MNDCIPLYQVSLQTKETTFAGHRHCKYEVDSVPSPGKLCKSFAKLIQVISISRAESADCHNDSPDIPRSSSLTLLAPDIFHN